MELAINRSMTAGGIGAIMMTRKASRAPVIARSPWFRKREMVSRADVFFAFVAMPLPVRISGPSVQNVLSGRVSSAADGVSACRYRTASCRATDSASCLSPRLTTRSQVTLPISTERCARAPPWPRAVAARRVCPLRWTMLCSMSLRANCGRCVHAIIKPSRTRNA